MVGNLCAKKEVAIKKQLLHGDGGRDGSCTIGGQVDHLGLHLKRDGKYRTISVKMTGKKMSGIMQRLRSDMVDTATFTFKETIGVFDFCASLTFIHYLLYLVIKGSVGVANVLSLYCLPTILPRTLRQNQAHKWTMCNDNRRGVKSWIIEEGRQDGS